MSLADKVGLYATQGLPESSTLCREKPAQETQVQKPSASDLGCDLEQVMGLLVSHHGFRVAGRWECRQLGQGCEPSTMCSRATCCPSVQGRVCDDCRTHVEPSLLSRESSGPLRDGRQEKRQD